MTPTERHELNRVMAKVCGFKVRKSPYGYLWALIPINSYGESWIPWAPTTDANQMMLVKAKLREIGVEYGSAYSVMDLSHTAHIAHIRGQEFDPPVYYGSSEHESELIAFGLAVKAWWEERLDK